MFYEIAQRMGVTIYQNQRAVRVESQRKFALLQSGEQINYESVIEAAGAAASTKKETKLLI